MCPTCHDVPTPLPITVSIVASNEAHNLPRCLASVRGWVTDVVVVINHCTDRTADVAREHGAVVHETEWRGYRDTKNWALDRCTQPWALCLDADEAVSTGMRRAIEEFFARGDHERFAGAEFARRSWFLNRWIRHGDWYPDRLLRLVKMGAGEWGDDPAHSRIVMSGGAVSRLSGDLLHFPFPDMKTFMWKSVRQSDDFVQIQSARGRRWRLGETILRPIWRFVRAYLLRLGFLDGFPGLYIAWSTCFVTFLRYSRLYERERHRPPPVTLA
ncbi:MAG: glycosyltransferase family 2 protein [Opitutus sp.]|nr:glycosyltransferase family 2 protein [Opitutus sp.]